MIDFHRTSCLWLSLENFYNRGVTPERAKTIIEELADPGSSSLNLRCHRSGLNGNWIVETSCNDPVIHKELVNLIAYELWFEVHRVERERSLAESATQEAEGEEAMVDNKGS